MTPEQIYLEMRRNFRRRDTDRKDVQPFWSLVTLAVLYAGFVLLVALWP